MKRMILPLRASSISSMLSFPPRRMSFRISSMETVRNCLFERGSLSPKQKESRKGRWYVHYCGNPKSSHIT